MTVQSDTVGYRNNGYNSSPLVTTPAVTPGTALQPSASTDSMVFLELTSASGDTPTVSIGPVSGGEFLLFSPTIAMATVADVAVPVPATWRLLVGTSGDTTATATVLTW